MKHAIEINGLTKNFGRYRAVDGLNLSVPEGKIYGFLGKNGAGKTTTLRMITGLISPTSGEIIVMGRNVQKERMWAAENMGAIVEIPGFYENLSGIKNLDITATMFDTPKKRISEVLELAGLSNVAHKKVREFSLGMKQRLGIANALVHSPRILLLDEPTNGLDPSGIRDTRNFIKELSKDHGITVMVSSHILSEVQQIADYVGIIDDGRLIDEVDIETLNSEEQNRLLLQVDDIEGAAAILQNMDIEFDVFEDSIKVYCSREMNCIVNQNLVAGNISVYNLCSVRNNLEDRFLKLVNARIA